MTIRDIAIALGFEIDRQSEKEAEQGVRDLKGRLTKLLGALGIGFSLVKINQLSEEFNNINDQLRNATREMGDQLDIQQQVLTTANNIRGAYGDTVDTMARLIKQNDTLFDTTAKTLEFVELTTMAWKNAARSDSEIAALNTTMNNAFAQGTINAMNFRRILQSSPETIHYMEKALGKTREELQTMAEAGTLSAEALYLAFTGSADNIRADFAELDFNISDAFTHMRNGWGLFIDGFNSSFGITQAIGNTMVKVFNVFIGGLGKAQTRLEWFAEKLGGADKLLKLIAITAGALLFVFNFTKITSGLGAVLKLMGGVKLKSLAMVAGIIVAALIIEDFINFMKGNDSLMGSLFEKMGLDVDKAREKIKVALAFILTILSAALSKASAFWEHSGEQIKFTLGVMLRLITNTIGSIIKIFSGLIDFVVGIFTNDWGRALNGLGTIWKGFVDSIPEHIKSVFSFFQGLPAMATEWGKDIITGLASGIWSSLGKVTDAVKGVGNKIKSFLHFSRPDEGPLAEYEAWMPDFMGGLAKGIQDNKHKVTGVLEVLTGDMAVLANAQAANPQTAANASGSSAGNKTINQYNTFSNEFNGKREVQHQASKAMDKSTGDATGELARALATL